MNLASRNLRLDSAKGVLILLVVLGHLLETGLDGWKRPLPGTLLTWVYLFHMPAFVFLAGMTAKSDQLGRRILTLLSLLLLFHVAYGVPLVLRHGRYPQSPWQPYWILWFLLSLGCWTALLPVIRRVPTWVALLGSLGLSVACGFVPWVGYPLGLSRTLVFLPFFVAGHLYGKALFARLIGRPGWGAAGALITLAVAIGLYQRVSSLNRWLYGSNGYHSVPETGLWDPAFRLVLVVAAAVGTLSLIAVAPGRAGWLTKVGSASLAVFLLHGFAITFGGHHFKALVQSRGLALELLAAAGGTFLLTWLLGRPVLDRTLRRVAAWPVERVLPPRASPP